MAETFDVTIYVVGKFSATQRKVDEAHVKRARREARKHKDWKVTVSPSESRGNGRFR